LGYGPAHWVLELRYLTLKNYLKTREDIAKQNKIKPQHIEGILPTKKFSFS